jgi:uncharacterized membrane protein
VWSVFGILLVVSLVVAPAGLLMLVENDSVTRFTSMLGNLLNSMVMAFQVAVIHNAMVKGGLSVSQLANQAASRWFVLILANMVVGFVSILGYLLLIVPGLIVTARTLPYPALVVVGGRGPIEAFKESWRMTQGHAMALFGATMIIGLVGFLLLSPYLVYLGLISTEETAAYLPALLDSPQANVIADIAVGIIAMPVTAAYAGVGVIAHRLLSPEYQLDSA